MELMARWSKEEETILKEMWENPAITLEEMTKVLKTRNLETIRKKARALHLPLVSERVKPEIDLEYYRKLMEVVKG